jgi:hypothetical protein
MSESAPAQTLALKTYAIPVSNGILEHRERIGSAVWLFLLLIDWTTSEHNGVGIVRKGKPIKLKDLMAALGLRERQVSAQFQRLKSGGYIRAQRTQYGYMIEVMKSKKFVNRDRQKVADLNGQTSNLLPVRPAVSRRNIYNLTDNSTVREQESKKPIPARSKPSDPRIKELADTWAVSYRERCGEAYPFSPKDFGLFKPLLTRFPLLRLKELVELFFKTDDRWIKEEAGFTVGVFVSRLSSLASISAAKRNRSVKTSNVGREPLTYEN